MTQLTTSFPVNESEVSIWPPPILGSVFLACILAMGITGNLIIIITYLRSGKLRTPPNILYVNLAIADLTFNLFFTTSVDNMIRHNGGMGFGETFCLVQGFATCLGLMASAYSIGSIAICRYIIIVHPTQKKYLTWGFCLGACALTWLFPILLIVPVFTNFGKLIWQPRQYHCVFDYNYNNVYNVLLLVFGFLIVSVVMFLCYIKICLVYRKSRKRLTAESTNCQKGLDKEFRLAFQLVVIYIIYNLCWVPYFLVVLITDPHGTGPTWTYVTVLCIGTCNISVNIFVYLYYNQTFRSECKSIFCKKPMLFGTDVSTSAGTRCENI